MEWLGYGYVMAGYKDYLYGKVKITAQNIRKAVNTIASAANKRLRRIASAGYDYQGMESTPYHGDDSIAGVRRFSTKGKSEEELYSEFKRAKSFMESELSSISGMKKVARDAQIALDDLREHMELKAQYEREQAYEKDPLSYVEYETYDDSERSEYESDSERSEQEPEYDFYGMFRGEHIYNYMRKNLSVRAATKAESDETLKLAREIAAELWGKGYTEYEMAQELYDRMLEKGIDMKDVRHRRSKDTSSLV